MGKQYQNILSNEEELSKKVNEFISLLKSQPFFEWGDVFSIFGPYTDAVIELLEDRGLIIPQLFGSKKVYVFTKAWEVFIRAYNFFIDHNGSKIDDTVKGILTAENIKERFFSYEDSGEDLEEDEDVVEDDEVE